jgi:hypothetical protein
MTPPSSQKQIRHDVGQFRCLRCGERAMITKSTSDVGYCYSIDCAKCRHWAIFPRRIFEYITQLEDYVPLESLDLNSLRKSLDCLSIGTEGNAK